MDLQTRDMIAWPAKAGVCQAFTFALVCIIGLLTLHAETAVGQVWLGMGYDAISQEYFLVTADTSLLTPDSVTTLKQTATALNEGQLSIRTRLGRTSGWDQTTSLTDLYWHHTTTLVLKTPRRRPFRARGQYRLNAKGPHKDRINETSPLSNYRIHELLAEGEQRFGSTSVRLRVQGEAIRYPDPQELAYDYNQGKLEMRLNHAPTAESYRELTGSVKRRHVEDSGRVSYREAYGRFGLGWSAGGWRMSAALEGARRKYDVADAGLDHGVVRLRAEWADAGFPARWIGAMELEGYEYDDTLSVLSDFMRMDVRQRHQFPQGSKWTPFVEPGVEFVYSRADDGYFEPRATLGTEFFRLDGWWANADLVVGYRDYEQAVLEGRSDYWRFGLNLLMDGPISRKVSFNLLYSQEWERHGEDSDNFTVVLLSAGLKYRL